MRAMSWSRYRCLSWSFLRIRTRLRRRKMRSRTPLQISRYGMSVPDVPGYTGSR